MKDHPNLSILQQVADGPGIEEIFIKIVIPRNKGIMFENAESMADYAREHIFKGGRLDLQEDLYALYFDRHERYLTHYLVGRGSSNEVIGPYAPIILGAVCAGAYYVVLIHNHPADSPYPSETDVDSAISTLHALRLCELELLDYLIITRSEYKSFKELDILAS